MTKSNKHILQRSRRRLLIFAGLFVAFGLLAVFGLNSNSRLAKQKYDTLIAVDAAGGDVESALKDLRSHIYSHMNTQIGSESGIRPPIQLQGTYDRLVAEEEARVQKINDGIYTKAQDICERSGIAFQERIPCIEKYVDDNALQPQSIEDAYYKFDFVPPRWSADLAGISIVMAGISGFLLALEFALYQRARHILGM